MSEKIQNPHENQENYDSNPYGSSEKIKTQEHNKSERIEHQSAAEKLKSLEKKVELEAKRAEEITNHQNHKDKTPSHGHSSHHNSEYRSYTGNQAIKRVQKHLKPTERQFSKIIHNQKVEIVSDVAGGTIARPTGLLYGGIFSLLSSLTLYIVAKHYGYEYTFSAGIIFFVGGFALGLLIEILTKMFKKA